MVLGNFLVPFTIGVLILVGSKPSQTLVSCLGQYELSYNDFGRQMCTGNDNILVNLACQMAKFSYLFFSSNLAEGFLLYPCFKKINDQNEHIKSAIGEKTYTKRRK